VRAAAVMLPPTDAHSLCRPSSSPSHLLSSSAPYPPPLPSLLRPLPPPLLSGTPGISNGSTFKQISQVFRAQGVGELVGPVLGWSSALASFGAFIIPSVLSVAIAEDRLSVTMFGFAAYYLFCFFLNFWFYLRPGTGALPCACVGRAFALLLSPLSHGRFVWRASARRLTLTLHLQR